MVLVNPRISESSWRQAIAWGFVSLEPGSKRELLWRQPVPGVQMKVESSFYTYTFIRTSP